MVSVPSIGRCVSSERPIRTADSTAAPTVIVGAAITIVLECTRALQALEKVLAQPRRHLHEAYHARFVSACCRGGQRRNHARAVDRSPFALVAWGLSNRGTQAVRKNSNWMKASRALGVNRVRVNKAT